MESRCCRADAQEAAGKTRWGCSGAVGGPRGSLEGGENAKEFRGRAVALIQPHWPGNHWRMLTGGVDRRPVSSHIPLSCQDRSSLHPSKAKRDLISSDRSAHSVLSLSPLEYNNIALFYALTSPLIMPSCFVWVYAPIFAARRLAA